MLRLSKKALKEIARDFFAVAEHPGREQSGGVGAVPFWKIGRAGSLPGALTSVPATTIPRPPLPEHRLRIDGKGGTGIKSGQLLHGAEIKFIGIKEKSITLSLKAQSYGRYDEREKTLIFSKNIGGSTFGNKAII